MPIVPTEPDLIDRLIEVEDALRRQGAGCGGSTSGDADTVTPPPEVPEPVAPDATRAIVLPGSCKKNPAGVLLWPDGNPWQFYPGIVDDPAAPNQLEAIGIQAGTDATPAKVRLNVKLRWVPAGDLAGEPVKRRTLLFKLPPGWWPVRKVSIGVRTRGATGPDGWGSATVEINPENGHVTIVPRKPMKPDLVDLSTITYDAGGGKDGQGDGSSDPTGGGCGAPWDDDLDNLNTPELPGLGGGGGGGGEFGDWTFVPTTGWDSGDYPFSPALRTEPGGCVRIQGSARKPGGATFSAFEQITVSGVFPMGESGGVELATCGVNVSNNLVAASLVIDSDGAAYVRAAAAITVILLDGLTYYIGPVVLPDPDLG